MKKILYVSANGYIGGAEKFLLNIAQIHAETKDNVFFLLFSHGMLEEELKKLNIPVYVLNTKFRLRQPYKVFQAVREIRRFLQKHNFSIIHSTMGYSHFLIGMSSIFSKVKRVWFQHGPIGSKFDYLASLFSVDILLFSSHHLMNKHYSNLFLRKARYGRKVIPLPVDLKTAKLTDAFSLRKSLSIEGQYVLGMMGRISRGKGYEIALKSFLSMDLENTKLIIVGSPNSANDKKYFDELKKIVEKKKGEEKVIFVPYTSDVSIYYKIFNLFLNPVTHDEGFGLSVAEAMGAGVPVISSPYGGLSEFVKINETAEVINARDADAVETLKGLIVKLKSDEIYAKKISKNAKDLIQLRFNFSQTYVAVTDVYQYLESME